MLWVFCKPRLSWKNVDSGDSASNDVQESWSDFSDQPSDGPWAGDRAHPCLWTGVEVGPEPVKALVFSKAREALVFSCLFSFEALCGPCYYSLHAIVPPQDILKPFNWIPMSSKSWDFKFWINWFWVGLSDLLRNLWKFRKWGLITMWFSFSIWYLLSTKNPFDDSTVFVIHYTLLDPF